MRTTSEVIKTEKRFPARMTPSAYERLDAAARALGTSVNQFMVQSALEKAEEVLEKEKLIRLSSEESVRLFSILDNPPEPNAQLKKAFASLHR
jgi:uncharacterized protein (DUF1778 family)